MIEIEVTSQQTALPVDEALLERAVRMILEDESISRAVVSVAVVDDPTIHQLNRRYLSHDYATDVLSFVLARDGEQLEGEVVVSADTAQSTAPRFGWSAENELLLYVIHGALHLVGCLDETPEQQAEMRSRERVCLSRFGLEPRFDEPAPDCSQTGEKKDP